MSRRCCPIFQKTSNKWKGSDTSGMTLVLLFTSRKAANSIRPWWLPNSIVPYPSPHLSPTPSNKACLTNCFLLNTDIYGIVSKQRDGMRMEFATKEGVKPFGPRLPSSQQFKPLDRNFIDFLLAKSALPSFHMSKLIKNLKWSMANGLHLGHRSLLKNLKPQGEPCCKECLTKQPKRVMLEENMC